MKSPLPTSFAFLLLALGTVGVATLAVLVGPSVLTTTSLMGSQRIIILIVGLMMLGIPVFSFLGVLAAIRYRQVRKALNTVGLCGNVLLLLAYLGLFVFTFWKLQEGRVSRRLGGPIEIAKDYK